MLDTRPTRGRFVRVFSNCTGKRQTKAEGVAEKGGTGDLKLERVAIRASNTKVSKMSPIQTRKHNYIFRFVDLRIGNVVVDFTLFVLLYISLRNREKGQHGT